VSSSRVSLARRTRSLALPFVFAACWLASGAARGHHSFAMYDSAKLVPIAGTVKEFQWTNPHALLWVNAESAEGPPDLWTIELPTSTGNLARMGWSKRSLKPGDEVVVEINPLRDGKHGGSFKKVTIKATGKVLIASANAADAGAPDGATPDPYGSDDDHEQEEAAAKAESAGGCTCSLAASPVRSERAGAWLAIVAAALFLARRARARALRL
jgi:Family of unknown function (DUF6152)